MIANSLNFDTSKLHRAEADVYVCAEIIKITLDTLSCDFEGTVKSIKAVKNTTTTTHKEQPSLQQALIRDGKLRKSLGQHLVMVTRHNDACDICKKFENRILIDDVYSGGSRADGNYPLLSDAINQGLFHDGCRHCLSTYFPEVSEIDAEYNKPRTTNNQNHTNKWIVFLLCLFFGYLGAHKFYEKKIGLGVLYVLTCGLCGIGWFVDLISILLRKE